ncbi:transporter substrate-binding domain-containing protein [Rathayibacter iranicus]|uniref:Solute-binding protein family 3/N-terminal domain-containing protein n=2 Tax=Rathayibacter iranicus TaxID=59737 RepID=A0AAD1ADA2_9MICO|nr:transporter substrate-binding domain-containing protein [Rathayibacter iranicus]AZZ56043.1 hypothetical protein C7V51_09245 [Rathayibacter iranicus]MWV30269.1 transporter substrate-binding domain-containing protein [Rathayibacter iranicus NCPPB 2253 = VKM Ac-1602]PPI46397.1 hypothetical protein C5E09_08240 [Rathayibacter iranicus]PPI59920.1 hypothetical protein C5E08_09165 [Rathayibacter iranicus]PPI71388.1 hypothetical protein C5E01_08205 [Rathayibacter iranicus]
MSMTGGREDGAFRVGYQRRTAPFCYAVGSPFRPIGFSVDVARIVLSEILGADRFAATQAVEVTSTTRESLLLNSAIDIECGSTTITEARLEKVAFTVPIFETRHRIAVRTGSMRRRDAAVSVAGIRGSTSQAALEAAGDLGFQPTFVGHSSIGEAFDAFTDDPAVGGIVADEVILRCALAASPRSDVELLDIRLGLDRYGFMMRPRDTALRSALDESLVRLLASASYKALLARWFYDELPGLGYGLGMRSVGGQVT